MNSAYDRTAPLVERAQSGFDEAQKCAGTADIVARVRRLPDGSVDIVWNRRQATEQRLRVGSMSGTHGHLGRLAASLRRPAPRGCFYVLAFEGADDRDGVVVVAPRHPNEAAAPKP